MYIPFTFLSLFLINGNFAYRPTYCRRAVSSLRRDKLGVGLAAHFVLRSAQAKGPSELTSEYLQVYEPMRGHQDFKQTLSFLADQVDDEFH
ncbi:hypothetical protein BDN72DRAFT_664587 [Pluteus cervinus]|uniref:Uncharacterized protein n=1 Tax=Pluteus cervinus TaxID=181527 RepID=A0ACD3BA94_9AGAR|nr:hypothetical protein BDN72DRAFT_664587 [Pluteus cervinus]